jgi:hypothetical protein
MITPSKPTTLKKKLHTIIPSIAPIIMCLYQHTVLCIALCLDILEDDDIIAEPCRRVEACA